MNDLEARFDAIRAHARSIGLDLRLMVGPRMYEGEENVTRWPDGTQTAGRAIGPDDATLAEELALCEGFIVARSTEDAA